MTSASLRTGTAFLLVVLGACAAPPPARWEKAGASEAAIKEALQECRVALSLAPQPHSLAPLKGGRSPGLDRIEDRQGSDDARIQRCMQDKGFNAR